MPTISTGVFRQVASKKQTALNTIAPAGAAGTSKLKRRVTCTLDLQKATYASNEIRTSQQRADFRHGVRSVTGSLNGELSSGGYQAEFESVLRQLVQAQDTTGAQTTFTAAAGSAGTNSGTITRSAGSFIADGFNVGDIVNMTGWTAPALANNNVYAFIVALTATVMTLYTLNGTLITSKASGDSVTIALVGKKTFTPVTAQTRDYYTIEHWFADLAQSEVYTDCVYTGVTVTLPATGMATVAFPIMGLNITTAQTQYFTSPAAAGTGPILASANGLLLVNGVVAGVVTAATITVDGGYTSADGIVGSNVKPDIYPGMLSVTGSLSVLFNSVALRDAFINETESSLMIALTGSNVSNPQFTSFVMNRIKFSGATKDDGFGGLTLTCPFTALENVTGGVGYDDTTLSVQDSAFV